MTLVDDDRLIFTVRLETGSTAMRLLEELACGLRLQCSSWTDPAKEHGFVTFYCSTHADAEHACAALEQQLQALRDSLPSPVINHGIQPLLREDWAETWKRFFHTEHVSPRVVIKPSWEVYQPRAPEIVVQIDPEMSFGTGRHGTTRACLQFLDLLGAQIPDASFLDIGCGSGILAIAAAKLGLGPITAFDNDPVAVTNARNNIRQNRVLGLIELHEKSLADASSFGRYRIVVANLLAEILCDHAEVIRERLVDDSPAFLILSGLLDSQYDEVVELYAGKGLCEHRRLTFDGWTSGCFTNL